MAPVSTLLTALLLAPAAQAGSHLPTARALVTQQLEGLSRGIVCGGKPGTPAGQRAAASEMSASDPFYFCRYMEAWQTEAVGKAPQDRGLSDGESSDAAVAEVVARHRREIDHDEEDAERRSDRSLLAAIGRTRQVLTRPNKLPARLHRPDQLPEAVEFHFYGPTSLEQRARAADLGTALLVGETRGIGTVEGSHALPQADLILTYAEPLADPGLAPHGADVAGDAPTPTLTTPGDVVNRLQATTDAPAWMGEEPEAAVPELPYSRHADGRTVVTLEGVLLVPGAEIELPYGGRLVLTQ